VYAGRVVSCAWATTTYVGIFGVWNTGVAVMSCVKMVALVDGVTAV
jgi:hypothetical protein